MPDGSAATCAAAGGDVLPLEGRTAVLLVENDHSVDEDPPRWAAVAAARRRALRELTALARHGGAAGVAAVTFATEWGARADTVVATGVEVHRSAPLRHDRDDDRHDDRDDDPADPFTTSLSPRDAALALEAGLAPRRVAVVACRAALHVERSELPGPDDGAAAAATGALVTAAHDEARAVLLRAARRRGPATVLVGRPELLHDDAPCGVVPGRRDVHVVLLATATVLAGAAGRSPRARDVAARLDRVVVPVGAA